MNKEEKYRINKVLVEQKEVDGEIQDAMNEFKPNKMNKADRKDFSDEAWILHLEEENKELREENERLLKAIDSWKDEEKMWKEMGLDRLSKIEKLEKLLEKAMGND